MLRLNVWIWPVVNKHFEQQILWLDRKYRAYN